MLKRIIRALRKPMILKTNMMMFQDGGSVLKEEERLSNKLNRKVILVDWKTERL